MKSNIRASKQDKNSSIIAKISDFVSLNAFVLMLIMFAIWIHQIYVVGGTVQRVENRQAAMIKYLKENVNKVYFLSASGMAISAKKSKVSYTNDRFKAYIANEIIYNLINGNVMLSSNYKITYLSGDEILKKNQNINDFYTRFVAPNKEVLTSYLRSLHRTVVDGRYPEYINTLSRKYTKYIIQKPNKQNGFKTVITANLSLNILVKSWIREFKRWDTREIPMNIPFKLYIDVAKYVNIGNPFGIHFINLQVPILKKPTATQVQTGKQ